MGEGVDIQRGSRPLASWASDWRVFTAIGEDDRRCRAERHQFAHALDYFWQTGPEGQGGAWRMSWVLGQLYGGILRKLTKPILRGDLELVSFRINTWGCDCASIHTLG